MTGRRGGSASGPFGRRRTSLRARLVRAGFVEIDRAGSCLHDEALSRLLPLAQAPLDGDGLDPVRVALVEELSARSGSAVALAEMSARARAPPSPRAVSAAGSGGGAGTGGVEAGTRPRVRGRVAWGP